VEGLVGAGDFIQARLQGFRRALPLGDVGDNPREADQLIGSIADLKTRGPNPADLAVGPHDAIFNVQTW
jgi:hypothetical protein